MTTKQAKTTVRKLTRFCDVPEFVRDGNYEVSVQFTGLMEWVRNHQDMGGDGFSNLDIDPDFQRPHVWTRKQQQGWIEYALRGGRTGRTFYFNHPGWMRDWKGDFVLVDGKQRLEAVRAFMDGEITEFGSKFSEYTDKPNLCSDFRVNVNTLRTRREVLSWYLNFNFGGTPHSRKELDKVVGLYELEVSKLK